MKVKLFSCVWLFATPWTAAYQAPPSMGFSRQEYWSGVPLPSLVLWLNISIKKIKIWDFITFEITVALMSGGSSGSSEPNASSNSHFSIFKNKIIMNNHNYFPAVIKKQKWFMYLLTLKKTGERIIHFKDIFIET